MPGWVWRATRGVGFDLDEDLDGDHGVTGGFAAVEDGSGETGGLGAGADVGDQDAAGGAEDAGGEAAACEHGVFPLFWLLAGCAVGFTDLTRLIRRRWRGFWGTCR